MFKSVDSGANWRVANSGLSNTNVSSLVNAPSRGILYLATWGVGVFRSTDGAANWRTVNSGLSSGNISALAIIADRRKVLLTEEEEKRAEGQFLRMRAQADVRRRERSKDDLPPAA
jgi:hypothetical protein